MWKSKQIICSAVVISIFLLIVISRLGGHCQIPCGIYDDDARFSVMAEDITTIEKSMKQIIELRQKNEQINQLVRWVNNKDTHADKLAETITYYFMAQRIKPAAADKDKKTHEKYVEQITTLHNMLIISMKCKQTTDLENVEKLRKLLVKFEHDYKEIEK